ncbi:MAG: DUF924 family protein [Caulobacteraceae bacterium]
MSIEPPLPHEIVAFWRTCGHAKWFGKSDAFDEELRERFEGLHFAAARGELSDWTETAEGALALLILLDQIPRNIFRGSAHSYATDPLAKSIAAAAIGAGHDQALEPMLRPFFYLPYEHSEALEDQDRSVALCEALGDVETLKWAELHHDIIRRFGRFPHRNAALGRDTTEAEADFLKEGGFAG